jgi:allophanate hydrolase subunit 2
MFGSASAHLLTGIGGGPLQRGAVLEIGTETAGPSRKLLSQPQIDRTVLRVTPGPQQDWFETGLGQYTVTEQSDRMGIRLSGPRIAHKQPRQLLTEGVSLGAVQVPSGGEPIILFVEHQTTGGYPKIANVISADTGRAGQLRPRDPVTFEEVTIGEAVAFLRSREEWLWRSLI